MAGWIIASESNIERIWKEVDDDGNETSTPPRIEYLESESSPILNAEPLAVVHQFPPRPEIPPMPMTVGRVWAISTAATVTVDLLLVVAHHFL